MYNIQVHYTSSQYKNNKKCADTDKNYTIKSINNKTVRLTGAKITNHKGDFI